MNTEGKTVSLWITGFKPFFYAKVADTWTDATMHGFLEMVSKKMGKRFESSLMIDECEMVDRKKLYGFDGGEKHTFVEIKFKNENVMRKVKK